MILVKAETPDNATNGDVICALWNVTVTYENGCYGIIRGEERSSIHWFSEEWWNAPYKSESNEEIYCDRNLCFNYECSTCPVNSSQN